jgi:hypothetical protein
MIIGMSLLPSRLRSPQSLLMKKFTSEPVRKMHINVKKGMHLKN